MSPCRSLARRSITALARVAVTAGLFAARAVAVADVVEIVATQDNTLYENVSVDQRSNGAGEYFFAGVNGQGTVLRGLVAFELVDVIPPGAVINGVSLTLDNARPRDSVLPLAIELRRVDASWGEATSRGVGGGGGEADGGSAHTGDATWLYRFFDTDLAQATPWSTPGGDFAGISATTTVGRNGVYTWESSQMISDVQAWVDDPETNFGWLLKASDETGRSNAKRFRSSENPTLSRQPKITVDFTPPVLEPVFRRGDANVDGTVDLSDIVAVLDALFGAGGQPLCLDAVDGNDDGFVDVSDAVAVALEIFIASMVPAPGSVSCGVDPTSDELDCASYDASCG